MFKARVRKSPGRSNSSAKDKLRLSRDDGWPNRHNRPRLFLPLLLVLILLFAAGCGSDSENSSPLPPPRYIVAADQLPSLLARPGVVLLAAASKDETQPLGYVNDAVLVDEDAWANFSFVADNLVDYPAWSAMIGALGISNSSRVIVYDDGELKFASRIRFLLAHFGVADASLVNGGFAAMQPLIEAGKLQLHSKPVIPIPAAFTANVETPIPMIFRDDVAAVALANPPTATLIDVRTPQEFDGSLIIPPDTRGGHIPGAVNLPIEEFFVPGEPNELMSPAQLMKFLTSEGFHQKQKIIVYCQDGAKSSLAALALLNAGFTNFSLYYLSYRNWQEDPNLPVEK